MLLLKRTFPPKIIRGDVRGRPARSGARQEVGASSLAPRRKPLSSDRVSSSGHVAKVLLRDVGQAVALNSTVFILGYKALSSGLSNAAIVHSWVLGTGCLAAFQWKGYVLVCLYFVAGTLVTKVGKRIKMEEGTYERNEGKRTPASVWGSGFAAFVCALLALWFAEEERLCALLRAGFVASFASKLSDTVASEIGKAYGKTTILISTMRPVPRGTDGAISVEGTMAGLVASGVYVVFALMLGLVNTAGAVACTVAAFLANNFESLLGATVQQKYDLLNNDVVNMSQDRTKIDKTAVKQMEGEKQMFK